MVRAESHYLLLVGVLDCIGEVIEGVSHLARSYGCGGVLERLLVLD